MSHSFYSNYCNRQDCTRLMFYAQLTFCLFERWLAFNSVDTLLKRSLMQTSLCEILLLDRLDKHSLQCRISIYKLEVYHEILKIKSLYCLSKRNKDKITQDALRLLSSNEILCLCSLVEALCLPSSDELLCLSLSDDAFVFAMI